MDLCGIYALFFKNRVRCRFQLSKLIGANLGNVFCITKRTGGSIHFSWVSFRKPRYIPSADALNIPNHNFESLKVKHRNGIEADIEQNQGPLEEGVARVC